MGHISQAQLVRIFLTFYMGVIGPNVNGNTKASLTDLGVKNQNIGDQNAQVFGSRTNIWSCSVLQMVAVK